MVLDAQPSSVQADALEVRRQVADTVRELRSRSQRSLAELAALAGIGKSTLHAIESGEANPGIETLWALARALGVPFGDLLERPSPTVRVIRRGDGPCVANESSTLQAHLLTSTRHVARVELYDLALVRGASRDAEAHNDGVIEHVLVTAGSLRVGPLAAPVELGPGDFATFPGDEPHTYEALADETRVVLVIEYP